MPGGSTYFILIRRIGLSNVTPAQIAEAQRIAPIVCVQNQYNLAQRADDAQIADLARDGIAYVPFFPLGGFTPLQSATLSDACPPQKCRPALSPGPGRVASDPCEAHAAVFSGAYS
jgi:aryl-alcohol dehydrogenase-like predicted oxidoreductase